MFRKNSLTLLKDCKAVPGNIGQSLPFRDKEQYPQACDQRDFQTNNGRYFESCDTARLRFDAFLSDFYIISKVL